MILLVEDSIRFYSSILPNLYNYILLQSKRFSTEALNKHQATLRMRGRPKVVLARNYQEAMELFMRYKNNCLGVISDARFPMDNRLSQLPTADGAGEGVKDPERSEEHTSELQSRQYLVCRLLLEKKQKLSPLIHSC